MNKKRRSFNLSLLLPLSIVLIFAAFLTGNIVVGYHNTRALTHQQILQNIEFSIKRLQLRIELYQANNDFLNIERELAYHNLMPQAEVVALIDTQGRVIAASQLRWKNRLAQDIFPDYNIEKARQSIADLENKVYLDISQDRHVAYIPVFLGHEDDELRSHRTGMIFASYNHQNLHLNLWQNVINQGATAWISTLIALLILFFLQRQSITRPLKDLERYAEKIGTGDFSQTNPFTGRGELFELGNVLEQTQHKLADSLSVLKQREQNLAVTLQSIGDALITTDTHGIITRINRAAEQLTGWSSHEALGKPLADVFQITHADTGRAIANPVEKVLTTRQVVLQGNQTLLQSRTGQRYHINNNAAPILDESGTLLGVILVFVDLSEKYRLREQLQHEKEHLQHILDNSAAAIYTLTPTPQSQGGFIFKYGNHTLEKISGFPISAWIANPNFWFSRLHPEDRKKAEINSRQIITESQLVHTYRFLNAQNEYRWIRDYLTVHRDNRGQITEILGIWIDITQEQQALQENQQLGHILRHSHNEIYLFDAQTLKFVQANEGACQNLGYRLDELRALTALDIAPTIDEKNFARLIKPLQQNSRQQVVFDSILQRKNNTLYPVEVNLQLYRDPENPVFCAIVQDTSERRATQHALQEAHQKLQNILAASPSVIYTYDIGKNLTYNFVSDNIHYLLGYTAEEFLTQPGLRAAAIHPDDRTLNIDDLLPLSPNKHHLQTYRFRHKDGHFVWLQDELITVSHADNTPVALVGSLTDISNLKNTEKQLSEERSLLFNLINNIPDLIFSKNNDGVYLLCNKAFTQYVGRSASDIIGHSDFDFVDNQTAQYFQDQDAIALSQSKPYINETWTTYPDGQKVCLEVLKAPFTDESGQLLGTIGISRNITERKLHDEQRTRLNHLKSCLSEVNQAINHIAKETDLFTAVCRILIEQSPLTTAWIGLFDDNEQRLKPITTLNSESDAIILNDEVQTSALSAFRQNRLVIHNTMATQAPFTTCAAIPILRNRTPYAVLTVCTDCEDYFDDDINLLLTRLTDELGFALETYAFEAQQQATKEKLELSAKVFEQSQEGIMICDEHNHIISVNRAFSDITGYREQEALGKDPKLLSSGRHDKDFYRVLWATLKTAGFWQGEIWNRTRQGEVFPEWLSISVVRDENDNVINYIGIFSDLSQHKEAEQRIERMAHYDPLTNLPNRVLLKARIDHEIAVAERNKRTLALLFIDLDHFKYINDSLGHAIGDKLLIEIAQRLLAVVREEDTVSRLGGDEFTVQLCGTDEAGAAAVADKILTQLSQPIDIEGNQLYVTPSIGISLFPGNGRDYETLSQKADTAMYHAKRQGRNQYQFFTAQMQELSHRRLIIENDLRQALEHQELLLHFQPQIATETSVLIGAEVLLRWQHAEWGLVSPAEFIPIAEDNGLILPIGDWVLEQAIAQTKRWQDAGYPAITVAVNLSLAQFRDSNLFSNVQTLLARHQLAPQFLELELTESIATHDVEHAIETTRKLQELGIQLSIDDFGTGYSSLSYLQRFAVHKLKIDQSFSRKMIENQDSENIVDAIISLAKNLKLKTIAEGVETEQQFNMLKTKGCDEIQGYYFSKPVPAEQFEELLKRYRF